MAKQTPNIHGALLVDKPAGFTSHDLVNVVRQKLGTKKVGHAGTLDPDATGLMLVGVGFGTKLLEYSVGCDKTYEAEITFGTATSTLDASGEVTETVDMSDLAPEAVKEAALKFVGDIKQVPPMVSALKVDGKRLHELAREGKTVERKARQVTVSEFTISETDDPLVYKATVTCSSGTYIRTLADDLGRALGGVAHLSGLRRTKVGRFDVSGAVALDDVSVDNLLGAETLLSDASLVPLPEELVAKVRNGQTLDLSTAEGIVALTDQGNLIAVYRSVDGKLKPEKVAPNSEAPRTNQY